MNIKTATEEFEQWLAKRTHLEQADLEAKHRLMAENVFSFLRATFYRWVQVWPQVCPKLAPAPVVVCVGDLHVENLGTWRDAEGRLAWGINDFDETYPMPYTIDLVRLVTSALLAARANYLAIRPEDTCEAILAGYIDALSKAGRPFVLAENHPALRTMAMAQLGDPVQFWQKLEALPVLSEDIPEIARELLEHALPEKGLPYTLVHRQAGLGSLGHRRYCAIAEWRGGKIAREVKELTPSAWLWPQKGRTPYEIYYPTILHRAVRNPDPLFSVNGQWIVRRLAPDCSRIELGQLPRERDEVRLLTAMGFETGNIHLGSHKGIDAVRQDVVKRPTLWLLKAAKAMADATHADWEEWRKRTGS